VKVKGLRLHKLAVITLHGKGQKIRHVPITEQNKTSLGIAFTVQLEQQRRQLRRAVCVCESEETAVYTLGHILHY
jgi:site-specific recombinase XerC